ncbi:protein kinase [Synechococcales cyanobacterium C]|uniref:Serine/threonine-protein kinase B n=1 Tax=Petrachloros mirabilis ULC683 TaxID=2781853 RepID=A0A8K2A7M2_9CYAN|nr:serine/threonine-protein kinase [Petrachloros mirabilis]NCJ07056.1 protein kinase [Petrachloros mirabilis ULC683]
MSYCLNPACANPNNPPSVSLCQACGTSLLLRDRYRATRILGRGGFATTFLAEDEGLPGRPTCVIKQLRPVLTAAHILEMSRELFQREATTLGKIGNHPQLPRLLDFFEVEKEFYLIQEYVSGATLQQEVRRSGPFDEGMSLEVLKEVLPILDYLHSQKVIHRDIKPANIIRRTIDNRLVLIDFGAVKDQVSQTAVAQEDEALTSFAVGTPGFAPPEQMAMRPVYASDVFSLGVTCVYLLTGKSPKDLGYSQTTGELEWQSLVSLSPNFRALLNKMLAGSLRDRFTSAKETLHAVNTLAQASPYAEPMNFQSSGGSTPIRSSSNSGRLSPSARAASNIRSQQTRKGGIDPLSGSVSKASQQPWLPGSRSLDLSGDPRSQMESQLSVPKVSKKLTASTLKGAYAKGQRDFSGCNLSHLNLQRFQLTQTIFHAAQFSHTDLREAILDQANFGRASLVGAVLSKAKLCEAYMAYADLEGADLRGADLSRAHLSNANLRGANLCGANLRGATLSPNQLDFAHTNWRTVMPNGKRGKKNW